MSIISIPFSIALLTALISGVARGYSGFASGLILVPIFALLFGPIEGIAISAVASFIGGLQLLPRAIKLADWKELTPPLIAAAIGCFFGVSFLVSNEPDTITSLMGIILILASLMLLSGWKYSGPHNTYAGLAVGGLSGGSLGAFGVPVGQFFALYFLSSAGDTAKQRAHIVIAASCAVTFFVLGLLFEGKVVWSTLFYAAFVTPFFMFGVWVGARLFQIMPFSWFSKVVAWLVAATGVTLILS